MSGSHRVRPAYITGVHSSDNRGYGADTNADGEELPPGFGSGGDEPPTYSSEQRKLAAKAHNEGVKLFAAGMNALAVAVLTAAVILPIIHDISSFIIEYRPVWYFVGVGLHVAGQIALRSELRSEE